MLPFPCCLQFSHRNIDKQLVAIMYYEAFCLVDGAYTGEILHSISVQVCLKCVLLCGCNFDEEARGGFAEEEDGVVGGQGGGKPPFRGRFCEGRLV